jgi:hypothetical protein
MHTFRATRNNWVKGIGTTLAVGLFFAAGVIVSPPPLEYLFAVLGILMALQIAREYVLPIKRAYLAIEANGLTARVDGALVHVEFEKIEVVRLLQDSHKQYYLWLCKPEEILSIPLKYLDVDRIWPLLRRHFDRGRVGEDAYREWIVEQKFFQEMVRENVELVHSLNAPLRLRQHRLWTATGWFTFLFFIGLSIVASLNEEVLWVSLCFFAFALLGLTLIFPGTLEMDAQKITVHSPPFGRYQISWGEVQRIEYSPDNQRLVFYADEARWLSIRGPAFWRAPERDQARALIRAQAHLRGIAMDANRWAAWKILSRNAKIG